MWVMFIHTKNGVSASCWRLMKSMHGAGGLVVDGLHPLLGQRSGVLDALLADRPVALVDLAGVLVGGPGVDDTAR